MRMEPTAQATQPQADAARDILFVRIAWVMAILAAALRLLHYVRNPPVWCDELWLLRNIIGKSFLELLGPLLDVQAAPPLFLWVEHTLWLIFGDNILVLRVLPLMVSCGMMLLLVPLARHCLRPAALPWAVFRLLMRRRTQISDLFRWSTRRRKPCRSRRS